MSLLVIHPPHTSVESLRRLFFQGGCAVTPCSSVDAAVSLLERHPFKAIFIVHPCSHVELMNTFQDVKRFSLSTFVITRRQSGLERVHALQAGVTNYFIEPFSYTQVVQDTITAVYAGVQISDTRRYADISVDYLARTVSIQSKEYVFSRTQFLLFTLLIQRPGQVFSRVQIWEHVWGYAEYPLTNTIDVHIRRLRHVLPTEIALRIQSVHGVGYRYMLPKAVGVTTKA